MGILDLWEENGFITAQQREVFEELLAVERDVAYSSGYNIAINSDNYEGGWDDGYNAAKDKLEETMRATWFDQGYEAALAEHGIEE